MEEKRSKTPMYLPREPEVQKRCCTQFSLIQVGQSFKYLVHLVIQSLADSTRIQYWRKWKSFTIRNDQAKDGQESTFYMTMPPLIIVRLLSLFLASEKVKVLNHPPYSLTWVPVTSFYFQSFRKCFLEEISIRLEVLLATLFIRISNRYQKKTICFSRLGKKVTKMRFSKGETLEGL